MTPYQIAWLVVAVAGIAGTALLFVVTRGLGPPWVRSLVRFAPLVALTAPAPVPAHPEQLAPAFVVVLFEGIFQSQGAPAQALTILLAALAGLVLVVGLVHWRLRGRSAAAEPVADAAAD